MMHSPGLNAHEADRPGPTDSSSHQPNTTSTINLCNQNWNTLFINSNLLQHLAWCETGLCLCPSTEKVNWCALQARWLRTSHASLLANSSHTRSCIYTEPNSSVTLMKLKKKNASHETSKHRKSWTSMLALIVIKMISRSATHPKACKPASLEISRRVQGNNNQTQGSQRTTIYKAVTGTYKRPMTNSP